MAKQLGAPELGSRLRRARTVAAKLAAETDSLNASLCEAEKALREMRLGFSWIENLEAQEGDKPGDYSLLFVRYDDTWALLVETPDDSRGSVIKPVLDAQRDIRVRAAKALPALVDGLIARAEEKLQEVSEAASCAATVVEQLANNEEES